MPWQPWCKFTFCFFQKAVSKRNTASNRFLRLSPEHALTSRQILRVRVVEKLNQPSWRCCIWQVHHLEKISCLSSFDSQTGHLGHLASCCPSALALSSFSTQPAMARSRAVVAQVGMKEPQGTLTYPCSQSSWQAPKSHQPSASIP